MLAHEASVIKHSDAEVMDAVDRPDFDSVARVRRLRYWNAALQHGPPALRAALDALRAVTTPKRATWVTLLETDLAWLGEVTNTDYEPQRDLTRWCRLAREDHHAFACRISRAWDRHLDWLRDERHRAIWDASLERMLQEAGLVPREASPPEQFVCYECGRVTQTQVAMKIHIAREHQQIDSAQLFAKSSRCEECGTDFRTRIRLIAHLRHRGTGCLAALKRTSEPLTLEEARAR